MDQIETLISKKPQFHAWPNGRPANWSVAPDVLRFIRASLEPSMRTLETGAGQTTVAFAIAGTHHVCITPDRAQAERIRGYCSEHGIEDTVRFIRDGWDIALPSRPCSRISECCMNWRGTSPQLLRRVTLAQFLVTPSGQSCLF